MTKLGAAVAMSLVCAGLASAQTPTSMDFDPATNHGYMVLTPSNWSAAQAAAIALGGHLVTISSQAENDFVLLSIARPNLVDGRVWIGLTDEAEEGTFAWVTGEPLAFANWSVGEPNDTRGTQDRAEMLLFDGRWNDIEDVPRFITVNGVVEFDFEEPVGACTTDSGCALMTAAACTSANGTYAGDFALCEGACCFGDGICFETFEFNCVFQDGTYMGDGVACADTVCPDLRGGCCFEDGSCDLLEAVDCADEGGTFQGEGVDCTAGLCPDLRPANDACGNAAVVHAGDVVTDSTQFATTDGTAACGDGGHADVWFSLTPAASGVHRIETCGSDFDTVLTVFDGCFVAEVACNDEFCESQSRVYADLTAGATYVIRVAHYNIADFGTYTLSVFPPDEPVCVCELDGSTGVDVFDLLTYLDSWFAAGTGADIDGTQGVDVFDLLFFLDCWFPASAGQPCP